jgi:nitrogen fixation protein FixH
MSVLAMETRLKGKHVLFILLGFFGIVFAVNAVFLYEALKTLPGEEPGATYEAGLRYNSTLAEQRAQNELHWAHKVQVLPGSRIAVSVTGADGAPVAGLSVTADFERPAAKSAHAAVFKEVDSGRYEAAGDMLEAGSWIIALTAQKPRPGEAPAIYRVKERLWIGTGR